MPLARTERLIKQSIKLSLTEKMMSGTMKLKDAMLVYEDAVYHIQCGSNFRTDQGNPKKSVMSKKRGGDTTTDKERVFLEIAEHIDSHSGGQFDITILEKIMEKN